MGVPDNILLVPAFITLRTRLGAVGGGGAICMEESGVIKVVGQGESTLRLPSNMGDSLEDCCTEARARLWMFRCSGVWSCENEVQTNYSRF